ncbi:hypothetical protein OIV83_004618 [Microbotryomycetes sp. JL201]|nr:hypothetical protein OIV83_004618 [Microbotryomycetes sp. JL201]
MAAANSPTMPTAACKGANKASKGRRGRKEDPTLPPSRSRDMQRAFRARRAAHLANLEARVERLERENNDLRNKLGMPPRPPTPEHTPEQVLDGGDPLAEAATNNDETTGADSEPHVVASPNARLQQITQSPSPLDYDKKSALVEHQTPPPASEAWSASQPQAQPQLPILAHRNEHAPQSRYQPAPTSGSVGALPSLSSLQAQGWPMSSAQTGPTPATLSYSYPVQLAPMYQHTPQLESAPATFPNQQQVASQPPLQTPSPAPTSYNPSPVHEHAKVPSAWPRRPLDVMPCNPTSSCCPVATHPTPPSSVNSVIAATSGSASNSLTLQIPHHVSVAASPIESATTVSPISRPLRVLPARAPPPSPTTTSRLLQEYCFVPPSTLAAARTDAASAVYVKFLIQLLGGLEVTGKGPLQRLSYTPDEEQQLFECCGGLVDCSGPLFDQVSGIDSSLASFDDSTAVLEAEWMPVDQAWTVLKEACYGAGSTSSPIAELNQHRQRTVSGVINVASPTSAEPSAYLDGASMGPLAHSPSLMFAMSSNLVDEPMGLSASSLANMILDYEKERPHESTGQLKADSPVLPLRVSRNVKVVPRYGLVIRTEAVNHLRRGWEDVKTICGSGSTPFGWTGPGTDAQGKRKCCAPPSQVKIKNEPLT